MEKIYVRMREELAEELRRIAKEELRTVSGQAMVFIREGVEKYERTTQRLPLSGELSRRKP